MQNIGIRLQRAVKQQTLKLNYFQRETRRRVTEHFSVLALKEPRRSTAAPRCLGFIHSEVPGIFGRLLRFNSFERRRLVFRPASAEETSQPQEQNSSLLLFPSRSRQSHDSSSPACRLCLKRKKINSCDLLNAEHTPCVCVSQSWCEICCNWRKT